MSAPSPILTLIDGTGYVHRAFHAMPPLSTAKGQPTNAVLGFANMVMLLMRTSDTTHLGLALDFRGRNFRHALDPEYKANRAATAEELLSQFPLVRDVTRALNVPLFEVEGVEADDVIATLATHAAAEGFQVRILTSDKDFMQLVTPQIELVDPVRNTRTGVAGVEDKLGVRPDQVVDYLSLVGDSSDNVAGLHGVGPKTAAKLLQEFGTIDALVAHPEKIGKPKLRELVEQGVARLRLNQHLVRLRVDVAVGAKPADLVRRPLDAEACRKLFTELEFLRLVRDLPAPAKPKAVSDTSPPKVVRTEGELEALVRALEAAPRTAVYTLADPEQPAVGLAFALPSQGAWYVPLGHRLLLDGATVPEAQTWAALQPYLESERPKVGHGLKAQRATLRRSGVRLSGMAGDIELAAFLLDADSRENNLDKLATLRLERELPPDVRTHGKKAVPLSEIGIERAAGYACANAQVVVTLEGLLEQDLRERGLWSLYADLEMPLAPILADMEEAGIRLDGAKLTQLAGQLDAELRKLIDRIYQLAGHEFAVASAQQLATVLFDELHLPVQRKTRTGPSLDMDTLEKLTEFHPLPGVILEHRSLAKLKSTYLDTLPQLADANGRIHTTYVQTGAATGRLSSIDPNLQNIPVRTDIGRMIREAFIASPGCQLVSADYSQIELRILAHLSGDPALLDSFAHDEDIHTRTAAEVHGIATSEVTPELRRQAKAVNFGIAYGQTSYGLSQRLGIEPKDAQEIINRYFARYAGVRAWLDQTVTQARRDLEVTTLFGRKRAVPDLTSPSYTLRQAAERVAVNAPIQGTAADIMKRGMLRVAAALGTAKLEARLLLQVHDELVFEVADRDVDALSKLAVQAMEGAAELKVRLKVDVGHSTTWGGAH